MTSTCKFRLENVPNSFTSQLIAEDKYNPTRNIKVDRELHIGSSSINDAIV